MTVSRWIDGVLEKNELIDQDSNLRGMFFWGHAPNSQTRGLEMKKAMDKLDLLVVIDPFPSASAAMAAMPGKPRTRTRTGPSTCCRPRRSSRPAARAPRATAPSSGARRSWNRCGRAAPTT
jgi:hypothetical protein